MIHVYGLKNCDRCRAALKWFRSQNCDARLHDVRAEGLPLDAAKRWIAALGSDAVINRRSTTWRTLPADRRPDATGTDEALALLADFPTLLKRPVMEIGGRIHIGFDDAAKADLINVMHSDP